MKNNSIEKSSSFFLQCQLVPLQKRDWDKIQSCTKEKNVLVTLYMYTYVVKDSETSDKSVLDIFC